MVLASSLVRLPVVFAGGVVADAFSATTAVVAAGAFALGGGALVVIVDGLLTVAESEDVPGKNEREAETATG